MKKIIVRNGKELTEQEYKVYLEGMAWGIWNFDEEMYGKISDPLYIGDDLENVYSYAFDFHDGGRHHKFNSLEEIEKSLLNEIKKIKESYD